MKSSPPLIVLIETGDTPHNHAETVAKAGFRVATVPAAKMHGADGADAGRILEYAPSVVAVELSPANRDRTWEFVRRFRRFPSARLVPCIVSGSSLEPEDIETAARTGALWLQLEPSDGARLAAAARGLLAAGKDTSG